MSASRKSTGGRKTERAAELKLGGENSPHEGENSPPRSAASSPSPSERPPRGRSGGPSTSRLPKPPQGHAGFKRKIERKLPRRQGTAPRYTNRDSKQQMLEAALRAAAERGYEAMRISEITDSVGVTRQAFYAHFRDKRHCMAEALDPKLGAIERMTASLSESDSHAGAKIAHVLDDLIAERFGSPEGTRGRLVGAMIELLGGDGSFHKARIGELVKAAHVPAGDFYRQFSGKGECFAVAYEQLLVELAAEVRRERSAEREGDEVPALLGALAEALDSDPNRRRILIVEMAHLPDQAPDDVDGARKGALREAVLELLTAASDADQASLRFLASSVIEVARSAALAGESEGLSRRFADLARSSTLSLSGPSESRLAA